MRAIDKRIGISAVGGFLIALAIYRFIGKEPVQSDFVIAVILGGIGLFLIYKGRNF